MARAAGTEEKPEAVKGVAHVERPAVGGVVHPPSALDGLVRGGVDQNHTHMGEEEEAYPQVVVCLGQNRQYTYDGQHHGVVMVGHSLNGRKGHLVLADTTPHFGVEKRATATKERGTTPPAAQFRSLSVR